MSATAWRPDIQRLRGIAVLVVVIYHSGLGLPGGFAGVDVFFVISGYVIANSLQRQIDTNQPGLLRRFYERRFRRLAPNYILMVSTTLILSHLFFDPYFDLPQIKWAAISSFFASTNVYFLLTENYDSLSGNPLRHLWSLGVEEHFYILLPWIYVLNSRKRSDLSSAKTTTRRLTMWFLVCSLVASLTVVLLASYGSGWAPKSLLLRANFFGSPLRFWEILAGVVVAQTRFGPKNQGLVRALRWTSSGILVSCFLALDSPDSFPNIWAVVIVAASCVLVALPSEDTKFWKIITRPIESLGNVSYALYLWHWPVFVIFHHEFGMTPIVSLVAITLSLLIAIVTTALVEEPFHKRHWPIKRVIPILLIGAGSIVGSVLLGRSPAFYQLFLQPESKQSNFASLNDCGESKPQWTQECVFGENEARGLQIALFGDSNARSASDGLAQAAKTEGWTFIISAQGGCPVYFSQVKLEDECDRLNSDRLRFAATTRPNVVVLVNYWSAYRRFNAFSKPDMWISAMRQTVSELNQLGIPALIQHQIPECRATNSLLKSLLSKRYWQDAYRCETTADSRAYVSSIINALDNMCSPDSGLKCQTIDVAESICETRMRCYAYVNRTNYFSDAGHLSPSASRLTSEQYRNQILDLISSEGT